MNNTIIKATELWKTYKMDSVLVHALRGLSLTIAGGDFVALMGPSGSGKSTLLHILGCLDKPTKGTILFEGRDVSTLSDAAFTEIRGKRVGFIFQTFNLMPTLSALQNVEIQLRLAGVSGSEHKERARASLEQVGLGERISHLPRQLSGGELQRVAIARAIAKRPALILADEPTGNLDSVASKEIVGLLSRLNEEGHTIVMVTHDPEAASAAKVVLTMRDGRLEQTGV